MPSNPNRRRRRGDQELEASRPYVPSGIGREGGGDPEDPWPMNEPKRPVSLNQTYGPTVPMDNAPPIELFIKLLMESLPEGELGPLYDDQGVPQVGTTRNYIPENDFPELWQRHPSDHQLGPGEGHVTFPGKALPPMGARLNFGSIDGGGGDAGLGPFPKPWEPRGPMATDPPGPYVPPEGWPIDVDGGGGDAGLGPFPKPWEPRGPMATDPDLASSLEEWRREEEARQNQWEPHVREGWEEAQRRYGQNDLPPEDENQLGRDDLYDPGTGTQHYANALEAGPNPWAVGTGLTLTALLMALLNPQASLGGTFMGGMPNSPFGGGVIEA